MPAHASAPTHSDAHRLLAQHAASSFSAQAQGGAYSYLQALGHVQPVVRHGSAWVGAGPPVGPGGPCAERATPEAAARALVREALAHGRRPRFFGVTQAFAHEAGLRFMPLGMQHLWRPALWATSNRSERSLAAQLRRAARRGVTIAAIDAAEGRPGGRLWPSLCHLVRGWQARHAMPPMAFVVQLQLVRPQGAQKLYGAFCGGRLVAFAVVLTVGQDGLLIEHLVRHARAPNGTAELLCDHVFGAHAHLSWATLGLAPLSGPLPRPLRWARALGQPLYNFAGLDAFKRKLRPQTVQGLGLAYPEGPWPVAQALALYDLLMAFAGGSLVLFCGRLMLRGPTPVLLALAAALPVWTLSLFCLPTDAWFVAPWVQQAWVAFDALLTVALCLTLRRPTAYRLGALAWVVAADTGVTLVEAFLYPGPKTPLGLVLHALGVVAPGLSALMLWGAFRRARAMSLGVPPPARPGPL